MQSVVLTSQRSATIPLAVVAGHQVTLAALCAIVGDDPEITLLGRAAGAAGAEPFLDRPDLRVLLVSLRLGAEDRPTTGRSFITEVKGRRPDVGLIALLHGVDGDMSRAALDAGADACCLTTTSQHDLLRTIKVLADGPAGEAVDRCNAPSASAATIPAGLRLSPRERTILGLIIDGYSNAEISTRLACAPATVHTHVLNVFRKLDVHDRVSAAVAALRLGLIA